VSLRPRALAQVTPRGAADEHELGEREAVAA
jgi:hypothetical protein